VRVLAILSPLGAEDFDAGTVKRLRTELENERMACQIAVNDLTCDVLDVEVTLAYAEHVLTNLPRLWRECAPTHRQALGRVLFPARVQFDGEACQTASWAFGFSGLEGFSEAGTVLVDLTGIEPAGGARSDPPRAWARSASANDRAKRGSWWT
jgi:hypothetical protein